MNRITKIAIISFVCCLLFLLPKFMGLFCCIIYDELWSFSHVLLIAGVYVILGICGFISAIIMAIRFGRKQAQSKILLYFVMLFLSLSVLLITYGLAWHFLLKDLPYGSNLMKFDSKLWIDKQSLESKYGVSKRQKMLKDLLRNIIPGKSGSEIQQLLGESLKTLNFREIDKDFIYYLGPERTSIFNIDREWLLIWLDENKKFKKYELVTD